MNPLRTLENTIAGLVEGTFGRMFKAEVRPMELAHKLAREMDENTTVSVSRVYAPNEYSVWLSPRDRARYEGVEHEVVEELCAYLLEHARAEQLALASGPHISFHTDESLRLGEFGIEARMARPDGGVARPDGGDDQPVPAPATAQPARPRPAEQWGRAGRARPVFPPDAPAGDQDVHGPVAAGSTMIFSNADRVREAIGHSSARRRAAKAVLIVSGRRLLVPPRGATIGRSRDCDIVLEDSSVSRRHAELRPRDPHAWTIEDLGSTNGVRVNGRSIERGEHELNDGDSIGVGSTELLFEIAP